MVDAQFGGRMRSLLDERGLSYRALAARTFFSKSYLQELATGKKSPTLEAARVIDEALGAGGALLSLLRPSSDEAVDGECEALELARRVAASDVGAETVGRLESIVDDLASSYATTPPDELLPRVRRHLNYVAQLLDRRATLDEYRRLVVVGGWLSLLAATVHIDLRHRSAALANLTTASQLGQHAGHDEILAWALETRAWEVLTSGDYPTAVALSRQAQGLAPGGSSAYIQATAQEGRAWARLGDAARTRDALARVERLVASLPVPDRPEHHYRYDPSKALSYTATTLAWLGDPAAEDFARTVVERLQAPGAGTPRPRRVAAAQLDLSLALLVANKPDEAAATTVAAIESGRVVACNWWRVAEVLTGVERAGIPEVSDLLAAFHLHRPALPAGD